MHVAEDAPVVSDDALERLLELLLPLLLVELHEDLLWARGHVSITIYAHDLSNAGYYEKIDKGVHDAAARRRK